MIGIIGAGPAGLTAAWELSRHGRQVVILEREDRPGGLSRTVERDGYRFDIGGHRFFTKVPEVQQLWRETLGDEFLVRPRLSRIFYDGKFFDYPLKPVRALRGLGPVESARIGLSYVRARLRRPQLEESFEDWVSNRFGRRLFELFFKTYTEKVWGIPCSEISADWASQRIKTLDLRKALLSGLRPQRGADAIATLIDEFHYPRLGPGQMWDALEKRAAARGAVTHLETSVERLEHRDGRVGLLDIVGPRDRSSVRVDQVVSSMPITSLIGALDPAPPEAVRDAAARLRYRDFLTVVLIVERAEVFPDNWIYIHSPAVRMGRIQNFKNWSPDMVPDPAQTTLGLEYFVSRGDDLWQMGDDELVAFGTRECEQLGLIGTNEVTRGMVLRVPRAYPAYDRAYRDHVGTLRGYLATLENLQTVGRNGMHRYNNQDHSMVAGLYAARRLLGGTEDPWEVNVDTGYQESGSRERLAAEQFRLSSGPREPRGPDATLAS